MKRKYLNEEGFFPYVTNNIYKKKIKNSYRILMKDNKKILTEKRVGQNDQ